MFYYHNPLTFPSGAPRLPSLELPFSSTQPCEHHDHEQDDDNHNEDGENNDDDRDGDDYENLRSEKMVMMTLIFIHRMPR